MQGTPSKMTTMEEGARALNERELTSIIALISYVVELQDVSDDTIKEILITHLDIEELVQLHSHAYYTAIRFLVDTQMKTILNLIDSRLVHQISLQTQLTACFCFVSNLPYSSSHEIDKRLEKNYNPRFLTEIPCTVSEKI